MAKSRVTIKNGAIRKLMEDPDVIADLASRGKAVADAANKDSSWGGYYSAVSTDGNRPRARVWNVDQRSVDDETRNNRLIRALDAGR